MKTVIFDFDGTLADTFECIVNTAQATLNMMGWPSCSDRAIKNVIGLPLRATFTQAAGMADDVLVEKAMRIYRELFPEFQHHVRLFPQVKEVLAELYKRGLILSVATSREKESLTALLDELEILPYFSVLTAEADVVHKKPSPDMALLILEKTGTSPEDALVVGDTVYDLAMGKGAGCHTCGVTYGNHSREQLEQEGADWVIDGIAELLDLLD